jgi:hypothetical protein
MTGRITRRGFLKASTTAGSNWDPAPSAISWQARSKGSARR